MALPPCPLKLHYRRIHGSPPCFSATNRRRKSAVSGAQRFPVSRSWLARAKEQQEWGNRIRPEIAPSAGRFATVAIAQLFRHFGIRGQKWMWQFSNGSPITGSLSQQHLSPPSEKEVMRTPRAEMYTSESARFRKRASRCGTTDAQALWGEALAQCGKVRLSDPIPLAVDGKPTTRKSDRPNVAFRFGVAQAAKIRACDDLKHSLTNVSCDVLTPIKRAPWGHLAQLSHLLSKPRNADWGLFKADHAEA